MWAGYWVLRGSLGGFAVASPKEFRQLVGGLWVGYLVDGFVGQNHYG